MTGRRIAVIGGGISGLTAGYLLARTDDVTLFEADGRLGGHADTHLVTPGTGPAVAVDTGFIVYNERTYPLLTRLFAELGVTTQAAEMSMSVRCAECGLEYAGQRGLGGLAAGVRRGGPRYLRMLADVPRFHRAARGLLASGPAGDGPAGDGTFGEFLTDGGYSGYFTAHFALPLVAAVWSCPPGTALAYPARYLFAFLANHGMLSVSGAPQWRTVSGGSARYAERVAKRLHAVRIGSPVRAVHRSPGSVSRGSVSGGGVRVCELSGEEHQFDAVVIATHPDQALKLLADPTAAERDVLGAFGYTANPALLHTDGRLLPRRRAVRASWNYELSDCRGGGATRISYDMNRLQSLPDKTDYIVTLGGDGVVDPGHVIDRMDYAHPAYTPASVAAQRLLPSLSTAVTAFAGAYHGWGFHEDGCRSGVAAARALGGSCAL
ncbi:MAG TPA: FAD-dependent oxidoreductase [Streptosporangiaceae bacterium]|nr:FAD-dependent oxidoreductase [Streptosporangiaceae bacterium]